MQSIPWKQTSRHQTNLSPAKATYAFPKDPRFKSSKQIMQFSYNIGVTHSITFLLVSEKHQHLVSEKEVKLNS